MIPLYEVPSIRKFIETMQNRDDQELGNKQLLFHAYKVSIWEDEKFLEMGGVVHQ